MLKAMAKFSWHLSNLAPLIRPNLFMKIDLQQWLDKPIEEAHSPPPGKYPTGGSILKTPKILSSAQQNQ